MFTYNNSITYVAFFLFLHCGWIFSLLLHCCPCKYAMNHITPTAFCSSLAPVFPRAQGYLSSPSVSEVHLLITPNHRSTWNLFPSCLHTEKSSSTHWQSALSNTNVKPSNLQSLDQRNLRQVTSNQTRKTYIKPTSEISQETHSVLVIWISATLLHEKLIVLSERKLKTTAKENQSTGEMIVGEKMTKKINR